MAYLCRCAPKNDEDAIPDRFDRIGTEDLTPVVSQRLRIVNNIFERKIIQPHNVGSGTDIIERIEENEGIFEGTIKDNQKNGQGCYLWYNGNFYNGNWEQGRITGNGTLFYANGGILKGNFLDGKLSGLGRSIYQNGDSYVGMWKDGMFHGKGLFYMNSQGQWQLGVFEDGSMVRTISQGEGKPSSLSICGHE